MRLVVVLAAALAVMTATARPARADGDAAWTEYDRAFVLVAEGKDAAAKVLLGEIVRRWPDHPAAARASARLAELEAAPEPEPVVLAPPVETAQPGGPSGSARGELVLWMTISGIQLGVTACVDRCESDRAYAAVMMATGGGALAASLLATRDGIRHGEAQLYNSAMGWGSWNALAINDGFPDDAREAGVAIGGQIAGLATGVGLWKLWRPTQGDVALTNTVFAWTTVLTLFGHLALDVEPSLREIVLVGDAAIVAGAILSSKVKMSRGRTFVMDIGGILGGLVGGLIAVASDDENVAGAALLVGSGVGLGAAAIATQGWDKPDEAAPPARLTPTAMGRGGYGGAVSFDF